MQNDMQDATVTTDAPEGSPNPQKELVLRKDDTETKPTKKLWQGMTKDETWWYVAKVELLQIALTFLIHTALHGLEKFIIHLADKHLGEEDAKEVKKWKPSSFTNDQIATAISHIVPHTGLKLFGQTIMPQLLPNNHAEAEQVMGETSARRAWPNQRDQTIAYGSEAARTGNMNGLARIPWLRGLIFRITIREAVDAYFGPQRGVKKEGIFFVGEQEDSVVVAEEEVEEEGKKEL